MADAYDQLIFKTGYLIMDDDMYRIFRLSGNRVRPQDFQDNAIPMSFTASGALKKMMLHGKGADKHAEHARTGEQQWPVIRMFFPTEAEWLAAIAQRTVEEVSPGWKQQEGGFKVFNEFRVDPTNRQSLVDCDIWALDGLGADDWAANSLPYFGWKAWPDPNSRWHCARCQISGRTLYECPMNPGRYYCPFCAISVFQGLRNCFPERER